MGRKMVDWKKFKQVMTEPVVENWEQARKATFYAGITAIIVGVIGQSLLVPLFPHEFNPHSFGNLNILGFMVALLAYYDYIVEVKYRV